MSDEIENQEEEVSTPEVEGPVCGQQLAEARRELQISVPEIAKELHLDEPKVRALERNEFDVLGAPVFAKGHLRTYAQLVNVDPDDVLVDYYKITRAATVPPVVSSRPKPGKELSPGPWIAVIVVVIIVVSAFWWFTRPPVTELEAPYEQTEPSEFRRDDMTVPAASDSGDLVEQTGPSTGDSADLPEQTAPPVVVPVVEDEPQSEQSSAPAVEAGQMRLLVTYSGDCWTEITDANGRRLLFDLGKDGRTVELSGAEPFNVLFGNPANVSLRVNGEDRELPPTRPDRPLRLTLTGS